MTWVYDEYANIVVDLFLKPVTWLMPNRCVTKYSECLLFHIFSKCGSYNTSQWRYMGLLPET